MGPKSYLKVNMVRDGEQEAKDVKGKDEEYSERQVRKNAARNAS